MKREEKKKIIMWDIVPPGKIIKVDDPVLYNIKEVVNVLIGGGCSPGEIKKLNNL